MIVCLALSTKAIVLILEKRECWGEVLKILAHIKTFSLKQSEYLLIPPLVQSKTIPLLWMFHSPCIEKCCIITFDLGQSWLADAIIPFYRGGCWGYWRDDDPLSITDWRRVTFWILLTLTFLVRFHVWPEGLLLGSLYTFQSIPKAALRSLKMSFSLGWTEPSCMREWGGHFTDRT